MSRYEYVKQQLQQKPKVWLVTGVAGFIGSNLLETLLKLNQIVVGLDNFATGHLRNLDEVQRLVNVQQWKNFHFIEGDICDYEACVQAVKGVDYVLHQAALGSVPRSIAAPLDTNFANITGFLNILEASRLEEVESFTYAASSSTYGDHPALPKKEELIGSPLSPYAVTKYVNELYAAVYAKTYDFKTIGLRYFNVFGQRQDPNGAYAAVIPKWTSSMLDDELIHINGDGDTSRDFCFIDNTVQMNILAATADESVKDNVFNVAIGDRTTLNELFSLIKNSLLESGVKMTKEANYRDFRGGDVKHSQADISKAKELLGYCPSCKIKDGINKAMPWYIESKNS